MLYMQNEVFTGNGEEKSSDRELNRMSTQERISMGVFGELAVQPPINL